MKESNEFKIGSVKQCLEILEELSKTYPSHTITNVPTVTKFLFRGVSDESYPLLPCVLREVTTEFKGANISNKRYTAWACETEILHSFAAEASAIIHDVPNSALHHWAEYAQHYGVPTRFLDWTANPLAAMYFACNTIRESDPAIWILNTLNFQRFTSKINMEMNNSLESKTRGEIFDLLLSGESVIEYPIIYQPYYVDQRMSAQSSYFMVWGNKSEPLEELISKEHWMILSNLDRKGGRGYGSLQKQGILLKLVIYNNRKQEILRQLDILGVNEKTLFPGLDGIGKYIERKYRFNYHEAVESW